MVNEGEVQLGTDPAAGDSTTRGSVVNSVYTERSVVYYGISETELSILGIVNTGVAGLFSLATFLAGLALSIWLEAGGQGDPTAEALRDWGVPILLAVAFGLLVLALLLIRLRGDMVSKIKLQSKQNMPNS